MNNEFLEQVSFTLDLLNLECKLACKDASADGEVSASVHRVEETLRAMGMRAPVDPKAK